MKNLNESNLKTLAHANELATTIIKKVVGEEVSNTVNGEQLGSDQIRDAVASKMQAVLVKKSGVL